MIEIGSGIKEFGNTATSLARNPLGIIALFMVLVYGFAALVVGFGASFSASERLPLIYFLIIFPFVVLAVFAWLVSMHGGKLFAPADYKNEDNYVKMQMSAVASLAAASVKNADSNSPAAMGLIVDAVQSAVLSSRNRADQESPCLLWVDDNPSNNIYTANAFEAVGIKVELALSTIEALQLLERHSYNAIISDMGRKEGEREGYVLLDALRSRHDDTPFYIHAGSSTPEHIRETRQHGGQGCTNNAQELFKMVARQVFSAR